jgi:Protein of unknown function (DUF3140)
LTRNAISVGEADRTLAKAKPEGGDRGQERRADHERVRRGHEHSGRELEEWLQTQESREVGQKDGGSESRRHESGRRIVEILEKDSEDYTKDYVSHRRDVVGYVHRHQAQRPESDVKDTGWRYSQIERGHDLRSSSCRLRRDEAPEIDLALV